MLQSNSRWFRRLGLSGATIGIAAAVSLWYYARQLPPLPLRTLRIGFEQNPPFQLRDENGFGGLAIEIVNEAARRGGVRLQWVETGASSEESLRKGLVDLWPLMADLPERRRYIHFSQPWLRGDHILLVRAGSRTLDHGFTGRIGLFRLPLHIRMVRNEFSGAQLVPLATARDVLTEVCRGAIAAGFVEKLAAMSVLKEGPPECASTRIQVQPLPNLTLKTSVASTFEAARAADLLRRQIGNQFHDGSLALTMAKYSFYGLDDTWATFDLLESVDQQRRLAWATAALLVVFILALWQVIYLRQRRRAERVLRESEQQFRAIFQQAGVGVAQLSLDGKVELANERYCQVVGYTKEELVRKGTLDITHREDLKHEAGVLPRLLTGELKSFSTEKRYARKDGSVIWATMWKSLIRDGAGQPKGLLAIVEDVTSRKEAEARLKESEERFRYMADSAPVMIWVSGPDKLCTFFNQGWLAFTGRSMEQELGDGWTIGVHPEDLERCLAIYSSSFDARKDFKMEYRLRRADGEYRWLLDHGVPRFISGNTFAGYIGSCMDITDFKRTQEEAVDRQKFESLGVLTGGIAHYFNNLLGGILASAELLSTELADGSPLDEAHLLGIQSAALRGGEIVRQLMIYSGEESQNFEPVDLARFLSEILPLLKASIAESVALNVDLPEQLPPILANAAQIRHVLINLILNAAEALGDEPGVISVSLAHAGDCVRLEINDTGCGMSEEIQARIFDPFFTTKFAGRGLGLAVVKRIILNHAGTINVVSAPGQGSRFEILLPCGNQKASATPT